jgi:16S rRNA (uracil1498-N3)-methyltransferase
MIRLHLDSDLAEGFAVGLDEGQSRYLAAVMRQVVGDAIACFNGRDGEWLCRIEAVGKRQVILRAERLLRPQALGPDLDLIIALVKRARLETIVEKAAELGARRVVLAVTERTNADHARLDRLQAIAAEAAEQTGRLDVPQVAGPTKLKALLDDWPADRQLMFCDEAGDAPPALVAMAAMAAAGQAGAWAILIGPEGGFSAGERAALRAAPFTHAVSLGPRILRADTAAISALTLWQAAAGDWRGA